jgi:hypothetical protein
MKLNNKKFLLILLAAICGGYLLISTGCKNDVQNAQCTILLSPATNSFTAAGGNGTVGVDFTEDTNFCQWTMTTDQPTWLHLILPGGTLTGRAVISYHVDPNTSTTPRDATITAHGNKNGDQSVAVHQDGGS